MKPKYEVYFKGFRIRRWSESKPVFYIYHPEYKAFSLNNIYDCEKNLFMINSTISTKIPKEIIDFIKLINNLGLT